MRLVGAVIVMSGLVAGAASAQGNWQPQASPSPTPPVYVAPPAPPPPAPRPPSGKERPARPISDPGTWVTSDAYPAESVRNSEEGTTAFRLTIDPKGKVTACTITNSSGFDRLDFAACELMQANGRFSPALDKKGKPTTGSWASRFKWVLPVEGARAIPEPFLDSLSFIVERDGTASNCTGTGKFADLGGTEGPCGQGARFAPYLDPAGSPVRRRVTISASLYLTDPDATMPVSAPISKPPAQPPQRKQP